MEQLNLPNVDQRQLRDEALDALEKHRAEMVAAGRSIAAELVRRDGTTCAPRVLKEMRARGYEVEKRPMWAGCLFRGAGWRKTGVVVHEGSHRRPAPLWELL